MMSTLPRTSQVDPGGFAPNMVEAIRVGFIPVGLKGTVVRDSSGTPVGQFPGIEIGMTVQIEDSLGGHRSAVVSSREFQVSVDESTKTMGMAVDNLGSSYRLQWDEAEGLWMCRWISGTE